MESLEFFISGEFWTESVLAVLVANAVIWGLASFVRAGRLGISTVFGRISERRKRQWRERVWLYARYREAYELARHINRTTQNGANFLYLSGLLFYVGAATLSHVVLVFLFLIVSVLLNFVALLVDARASGMYQALNSAGRVRVRREIALRTGSPRRARMHARSIR